MLVHLYTYFLCVTRRRGTAAGGGTHIWKWRMSATKHLRCRGLSLTNCVKKGGLSVTKRTKIGGLSVKCIKKIGAFRAKMAKIFSTFRQKCRNFRKIGGHWVKLGKNVGLSVKARGKKVGSFWWHMARNPKLSAPPGTAERMLLQLKKSVRYYTWYNILPTVPQHLSESWFFSRTIVQMHLI